MTIYFGSRNRKAAIENCGTLVQDALIAPEQGSKGARFRADSQTAHFPPSNEFALFSDFVVHGLPPGCEPGRPPRADYKKPIARMASAINCAAFASIMVIAAEILIARSARMMFFHIGIGA